MVGLCLVLLLNSSGQKNYINIYHIAALEESGNRTIVYVNRSSTSLYTNSPIGEVIEKVKEAQSSCKDKW